MRKIFTIFFLMAFMGFQTVLGQTQPEGKPQLITRGNMVLGTLSIIAQDQQEHAFTASQKADNSVRRMSGEGFEFRYNSYIVTTSNTGTPRFKTRFFSVPVQRIINIGFYEVMEPIVISVVDAQGKPIHKQSFQQNTFTYEHPVDNLSTDRFYIKVQSAQGQLLDTYIFEKIE